MHKVGSIGMGRQAGHLPACLLFLTQLLTRISFDSIMLLLGLYQVFQSPLVFLPENGCTKLDLLAWVGRPATCLPACLLTWIFCARGRGRPSVSVGARMASG